MTIESRIAKLEAGRTPKIDVDSLLASIERSCRGLSPQAAQERTRQFMRKLDDATLLEIAGLGPNPAREQLEALAAGG